MIPIRYHLPICVLMPRTGPLTLPSRMMCTCLKRVSSLLLSLPLKNLFRHCCLSSWGSHCPRAAGAVRRMETRMPLDGGRRPPPQTEPQIAEQAGPHAAAEPRAMRQLLGFAPPAKRARLSRPELPRAAPEGRFPLTQQHYQQALLALRSWICLAVRPVLGPARWNQVLAAFREHLYDTGQPMELGRQVMSAHLWTQPAAAGPLGRCPPAAAQLLIGWGRLPPGRSKSPLRRAVTAELAAHLCKTGRRILGLAEMAMFVTYFSSGELLAVPNNGNWIATTASGRPRDQWLEQLRRQRARVLPPATPLGDVEFATLLRVMREAALAVDPGIPGRTPPSCPREGASHDCATGARRLPENQAGGKRPVMIPVRRYENLARTAVQWALLAPSVQLRRPASEEELCTAFAGAWLRSLRGAGGETGTSSSNFSPAVAGSVQRSAGEDMEYSASTSLTTTASTSPIGESTASCGAGSSQARSGGSGVARPATPSRKQGARHKAAPSRRP